MARVDSEVEVGGTTYMLVRGAAGKRLAVRGDTAGLEGRQYGDLFLCPLVAHNAAAEGSTSFSAVAARSWARNHPP